MTFPKTLTLLIFSFLALPLLSQNGEDGKSFKSAFEEGNKLIEEGIYDQALKEFKRCAELKPENANVNYKVGYCYIEADKDKKEALPYLAKASNDITQRYDPYSHREDQAPPKARYYFGRALHLNMLLDSAISVHERFQESVPKNHVLYSDSKRQVEMCKFAKEQVRDRKDIVIRNIGEPINTQYHEYSPVISVDENVMYFTSRRPPKDAERPPLETDGLPFEAIYASYKNENGQWGEPEPLPFNKNTRHDAVSSTSPDGQKLFIFRSGKGNGDLYRSHLQGPQEWSEPQKMGSDINTDALEPHGVLSPDEKTFYFVSGRKGGEGGRDIYRVKKLPTGDWSKAQNLGPTINTSFDEDACFIHPDGKTMYFSSSGHQSMGGYDIFFSEKQDDGSWSEPTNMGFPINTVDNDRFFVTSADGKRGYYASEKEDGLGGRDIYQLRLEKGRAKDLAVMKGFINVAEDKGMPEGTQVKVTNKSTGETKLYRPRERDGVFVSILPPCQDYKIEYMVGNEAFKTETVSIPCEASYQEINKEVYLNPVDLGESRVVEKSASRNRKWKVLQKGDVYRRSDVVVKYVTEDGNVMFTESVGEDGTFDYYQLPKQDAYRFELETDEPHLCQELELLLVDDKGNEIGRTERTKKCNFIMKDVRMAEEEEGSEEMPDKGSSSGSDEDEGSDMTEDEEKGTDMEEDEEKGTDAKVDKGKGSSKDFHQERYDYNEKGLDKDDPAYQRFLERVKTALEGRDKIRISIRGNASKVPTSSYPSNQVLAEERAKNAKKELKEDLKDRGVDLSSITFSSDHQVSGPAYEEGDIRPKKEYMEHQYVRLQIEE